MISIDRAKKIINCYGGDPTAWPEHERQLVQQLLLESKSLSDLQKKALALDIFMGISNQSGKSGAFEQQCADKIMAKLPEQQQEIKQTPLSFIDKFYLVAEKTLKKPSSIALVASIVMIAMGVSNGWQFNNIKKEPEQLSLSEYMTIFDQELNVANNDEQLEILAFLEPQILED